MVPYGLADAENVCTPPVMLLQNVSILGYYGSLVLQHIYTISVALQLVSSL